MGNKTLEEIFWDKGNFYNEDSKKINPKPIGKSILKVRGDPRYIKGELENLELPRLIKEDESYQEVNAYLEGPLSTPFPKVKGRLLIIFTSYNFYKI